MNVDLAIELSKLVHNECKDVPHDIGIRLIRIVEKHEEAINYTRCCAELPTKEDLSSLISKVTPIMEEEDYEPEQILKWVCAFKDGFRYGQKPKK